MSSRIVRIASTRQRLRIVSDWLSEIQGTGDELVVVARHRGAVEDLIRKFAFSFGGLIGVHQFTLLQFAARIAADHLAAEGYTTLSRLGAEALSAQCVESVLTRGRLRYFEPVARTPGFVRTLAATIQDLRLNAVDLQELAATDSSGADLAELTTAFEKELQRFQLADAADLYRRAVEQICTDRDRFARIRIIMLDLQPENLSESKFLAALASEAAEIRATLPLWSAGSSQLSGAIGCQAETLEAPSPERQGTLTKVQESLFEQQPPRDRQDRDDSFVFFSAAGEGQESVEIARRVLGAAQGGVPFDKIGVLLRQPDLYQSQLEEAFRRAELPAFFSRGSLRPDPAGRAFLALLSCASENLAASRFAEYLSLAQVPDVDANGAPPEVEVPWVATADEAQMTFLATQPEESNKASFHFEGIEEATQEQPVVAGGLRVPARWEKLIVDAAVVGGRDRWERRLNGLEAELKLRSEEAGKEERLGAWLDRQTQLLRNLKHFALPLVRMLDAWPAAAPWGDWIEKLRELAARALRNPEGVLEVLSELQPMSGVGPVSLQEVQSVLTARLQFLRREPAGTRYGKVFIGSIEEAAGRTFQIVFLPGLGEGIFPRKSLEDPLLLDSARKRLSPWLRVQRDRLQEERSLLQTAVSAASTRLVASYSRLDLLQGRARVPSLYALELVQAADGHLPTLHQLEAEASAQAGNRLGWPAPADPSKAIDSAEYDLASLAPILFDGAEPTPGAGEFLLHLNPFLARSLRARFKRWERGWSDDDGLIVTQSPDLLARLDRHRLHNRSYSPTALQRYSVCPYQFALYTILRLRPREEAVPLESMDPLVRGSIFHRIQFELLRRLKADGILAQPLSDLDKALNLADQVIDAVADRFREKLAPAIDRIWTGGIEDLRVDVRAWLRHLAADSSSWEPVHFEYAFGLAGSQVRDPDSTKEEACVLGAFRLRGAIDLVEKNRKNGRLRVTDHKTGSPPRPTPRIVGKGEALQPLLYGLAAEALLGHPVQEGRLFYSTQRGDFEQHSMVLDETHKGHLRRILTHIDRAIERGFLPAAPRADACRICDYRTICGPYEEMRVGRKASGPLKPLEEIRKVP